MNEWLKCQKYLTDIDNCVVWIGIIGTYGATAPRLKRQHSQTSVLLGIEQTHRDGLPTRRRLPIVVLTKLDVDQLHVDRDNALTGLPRNPNCHHWKCYLSIFQQTLHPLYLHFIYIVKVRNRGEANAVGVRMEVPKAPIRFVRRTGTTASDTYFDQKSFDIGTNV